MPSTATHLMPVFSSPDLPQTTDDAPTSPKTVRPTTTTPATSTEQRATRQVWALTVRRAATHPEHATHPYQVIWHGDPTLHAPNVSGCAYCHHLMLTECPGMQQHAEEYAVRFATNRSQSVEVGEFAVNAGLIAKADISSAIEATLARRDATSSAVTR